MMIRDAHNYRAMRDYLLLLSLEKECYKTTHREFGQHCINCWVKIESFRIIKNWRLFGFCVTVEVIPKVAMLTMTQSVK